MIIPFIAAFIFILIITLQYGDIADRRWRSVAWEPLISIAGLIGITEVVRNANSVWPYIGYALGATAATAVAIYFRRRNGKAKS